MALIYKFYSFFAPLHSYSLIQDLFFFSSGKSFFIYLELFVIVTITLPLNIQLEMLIVLEKTQVCESEFAWFLHPS